MKVVAALPDGTKETPGRAAAATGAKKVSDAAKDIQSLLGDHQDSVVSRTHLAQQAEAAHAAR